MMTTLAIVIFLLTLTFVIWQPKGLDIGITLIGVRCDHYGCCKFFQCIRSNRYCLECYLNICSVILISLILDEIGFLNGLRYIWSRPQKVMA